jgi:hypothetical protein
MSNNIIQTINAEAVRSRLAQIIARHPDAKERAVKAAGISTYTLDRYLFRISDRTPLIPIALICRSENININWLLYGKPHEKNQTTETEEGQN